MKGMRSKSHQDLPPTTPSAKKRSPKKLRFSNNVICEYEVPSTRAGTETKATPTPDKPSGKKQEHMLMISPLPPRSSSFTESEVESHRPLKIDKENASLRPLLRKYNNVEESVRTLKMHDVNYQIIAEDPPSKVSNLPKLTLRRTILSNKG